MSLSKFVLYLPVQTTIIYIQSFVAWPKHSIPCIYVDCQLIIFVIMLICFGKRCIFPYLCILMFICLSLLILADYILHYYTKLAFSHMRIIIPQMQNAKLAPRWNYAQQSLGSGLTNISTCDVVLSINSKSRWKCSQISNYTKMPITLSTGVQITQTKVLTTSTQRELSVKKVKICKTLKLRKLIFRICSVLLS